MASSLVKAFQGVSLSDKEDPVREGHGFRYEELVIALVFLRCLREQLDDFEVTSEEHEDWDKFDDVVVTWRSNRKKYALLVQLKHKTAKEFEEIRKRHLFSSSDNVKSDFKIGMYQESYRSIKQSLRGTKYLLVLYTNVHLHENALDYFDELETDSVFGAELLETGGCVYDFDPDQVSLDSDFMDHFVMFCGQKDVNKIRKDVKKEMKKLLGSPRPEDTDNACDELCERVMKWKDRGCTNPGSLTSNWSEWKDIKRRYRSN